MPPASIYIMPLFFCPGGTEAVIRSQYSLFVSLGINSFMSDHHQEDYRDNPNALLWYDRVYDLAAEYGIKIFWYTSTWRYKYTDPIYNQKWIDRYKVKSACGGWLYADEPAARAGGDNWPYDDIKAIHDDLNSRDPNHPNFAIWTQQISSNWFSQYLESCHKSSTDNWCKLYDWGSVDIYPGGEDIDWETSLRTSMDDDYIISSPYSDGWGDCGKDFLPVIQAFVSNGMPDIVGQHNVWDEVYGVNCKIIGIGLWGAPTYIFGSGANAENIREQIRNLALLKGWIPEKKLSGSLTFTKTFGWKQVITTIAKYLVGNLNFSSMLPKKIFYPILAGKLTFSGTFGLTYTFLQPLTWTELQSYLWRSISIRRLYLKFISPLLSGALNFIGSLNTKFIILKAISGVLTFSSVLSHNFKIALVSAITFIGRTHSYLESLTWTELQSYTWNQLQNLRMSTLYLKAKNSLFGVLSSVGFIKAEETVLRICEKTYTFLETLTWTQFENYTWCKAILKAISLSGLLSPTGLLPKKISPALAGVLSFVGNPFLKAKSIVVGALNPSGTFTKIFIQVFLSGSGSFSGVAKKFIKYPLSGVLSCSGYLLSTVGNLKYLLRKLIQLIQTKGSK